MAVAVVSVLTVATTAFSLSAARTGSKAAQTIDEYLGCTRTIQEVLESHLNDGYYLGTVYGNTGPMGYGDLDSINSWGC